MPFQGRVRIKPITITNYVIKPNQLSSSFSSSSDFLPTFREECHFSDDIQGEWVWYERDRKENIQVSGGFIGFSRIGGFICKGKHWDGSDYKLFSYYKNGW